MALNDNLLVSWNFEKVTGSNANGEFILIDSASSFQGKGANFAVSDSTFVLKETLRTNRKLNYDSLESTDSISIKEEQDDLEATQFRKPSSLKLMIENSMYQIISDDMLNLFATIDAYTFKFAEPSEKFNYEYKKLYESRKQYFSTISNNPNFERYIEFYKWLDSSLGYMLDQLKPASTNVEQGLKNTVESHILERSKHKHKLPLFFNTNKFYSGGVTVIKNSTLSSSNLQDNISGTTDVVYSIDQSLHRNKNYDSLQTAGKKQNNRGAKPNDTVFQTRFSAGDGLSEINRHEDFEEYSVYNESNQKARLLRDSFNTSVGAQRPWTQTSSYFEDNEFIQRNVPYSDSQYHETGVVNYQNFPNEEVLFRQRNNLLIDDEDTQTAVVEPPIQFGVPTKSIIKVANALEDIEVYAPYSTEIETFTPRTLNTTGTAIYFDRQVGNLSPQNTFYVKEDELETSGAIQIKRKEKLEYIYPRKDLMGRAKIRTKPNYEEISGTFSPTALTWSQNSYNNNSANIRSFWRNTLNKRIRQPTNLVSDNGAINCVDYPMIASNNNFNINYLTNIVYLRTGGPNPFINPYVYTIQPWTLASASSGFELFTVGNIKAFLPFQYSLTGKHKSSFYSLDGKSDLAFDTDYFLRYPSYYEQTSKINESNTVVSDLGPIPQAEKFKFIKNDEDYALPKPSLIFNNNFGFYIQYNNISDTTQNPLLTSSFYINDSYANDLDTNLNPAYDSYEEYFKNIKGKSTSHSIIPEYTIQKNSSILLGNSSNDLSILGNENFDQIRNLNIENNFILDFNKFINKKSNKIKIVLNGIKKLLPYNGFYPNQRIPQLVSLFSSSYFEKTFPGQITALDRLYYSKEVQTLLQPLFAPGILNNTIKAGVAVDFPVIITGSSANANNSSSFYSSYNRWNEDPSLGITNITNRIPFEAILNPELLKQNLSSSSPSNLLYLDPLQYVFVTSSRYLPKLDLKRFQKSQPLYRYAINNFLGEILNFFLKNNKVTQFISKPSNEWKEVKAGEKYYLRIKINKNNNFSMFTTGSNNFIPIGSLFGPPSINNENYFSSSAYSPYMPSYFRGGANLLLEYTAPSYGDNLNAYKLDYYKLATQQFIDGTSEDSSLLTTSSAESGSFAFNNRMSLLNSLNCFEFFQNQKTIFDSISGKPIQTTLEDSFRWAIQTKFESPLINYTNIIPDAASSEEQTLSDGKKPDIYLYNTSSNTSASYESKFTYNYSSINGIWNRLGEIPQDQNSIQISIDDDGFETNSLLDVCGFTKETKTIGSIAGSKVISEAVLMIPFVENINSLSSESKNKFYFSDIEQKFLLKTSEDIVNNILLIKNYKDLTINEIKTIVEKNELIDKNNSVYKTIEKMLNYNVPNHLNWLLNKDIPPLLFIISEFNHILSKQDIANIWQGTLPEIGTIPEEQQIVFEDLFSDQKSIFKNFENELFTEQFKLKVLKIKKRAIKDFSVTRRFIKYDESTGAAINDLPEWYSYNWPYDYFSLVELVNIQAGEVYESGSV